MVDYETFMTPPPPTEDIDSTTSRPIFCMKIKKPVKRLLYLRELKQAASKPTENMWPPHSQIVAPKPVQ